MIPSLSRELEDRARRLVMEDVYRTRPDLGGLVEALVAIHKPTKCWGLGAKLDQCECCHETWPCQTLRLICDAIGQSYPDQQKTGCDGMIQVSEPDSESPRGAWTICVLDRGHDGDCEDDKGVSGPFTTHEDAFGF